MLKKFNLYRNVKFFSQNLMEQNIEKIKFGGGSFDRLINIYPDSLTKIPSFLSFLNEPVNSLKDFYFNIYEFLGIPNYLFITILCFGIRIIIFPLIYSQIKYASNFALGISSFRFLNVAKKNSKEKFVKKYYKLIKFLKKSFNTLEIKPLKIFSFYLVYYPVLLIQVWSIRKFIYDDLNKYPNNLFLGYIDNIFIPDPYYILPIINCALLYYNFGRFITKENEHLLINRIKRKMQIVMILLLPFVSCWPSGIVFYMVINSFFSVLQTTYTTTPKFLTKINPNLLVRLSILSTTQIQENELEKYKRSLLYGESSLYGKEFKSEEQLLNNYKEFEKNKLINKK